MSLLRSRISTVVDFMTPPLSSEGLDDVKSNVEVVVIGTICVIEDEPNDISSVLPSYRIDVSVVKDVMPDEVVSKLRSAVVVFIRSMMV